MTAKEALRKQTCYLGDKAKLAQPDFTSVVNQFKQSLEDSNAHLCSDEWCIFIGYNGLEIYADDDVSGKPTVNLDFDCLLSSFAQLETYETDPPEECWEVLAKYRAFSNSLSELLDLVDASWKNTNEELG